MDCVWKKPQICSVAVHCGDAAGGSESWQKRCASAGFVLADLWQVGTCVCVTVMLFLAMRALL